MVGTVRYVPYIKCRVLFFEYNRFQMSSSHHFNQFSATSASWLVGTVVGHQYGWLRNGSDSAQARRWIPDLETGWEYRPLTRSSELSNTWCTDDGTLRIESLRGNCCTILYQRLWRNRKRICPALGSIFDPNRIIAKDVKICKFCCYVRCAILIV